MRTRKQKKGKHAQMISRWDAAVVNFEVVVGFEFDWKVRDWSRRSRIKTKKLGLQGTTWAQSSAQRGAKIFID